MAKRSLYASPSGIKQAKTAFSRKGWTQENLAFEVNLKTRQPIWRFFTGRPIERYIFVEICSILELNWRDVAENPPDEIPEYDEHALPEIDCLVQQVRSQRQDKIEDQCGTLKLLDINRPVNLDKIYIEVNLLEEIPSQQWLELAELQNLTPQEFQTVGLDEIFQQWIVGIQLVENYTKIRVLGNPGTGKTTFLQHLALQCNRGLFMANRVPIFITLKSFVEESKETGEVSFLNYIRSEFLTSNIINPSTIDNLLCEGRVLLLLDGLDEVLTIDTNAVYQEINRFTEKYHKNLFIITCRTAGKIHNLNGFIDVEIAPFTSEQITEFSQKWFATLIKNPTEDTHQQAVQFIQSLDLPENLRFRQLAATPLFLHLACWIFVHQGQFPSSESEFYKQCLDLLLGKWDEIRGVQRDSISPELALPQKLKLLSEIAIKTFERGEYFFEKRTIEEYISDYLYQLSDTPIDSEELQLASEDILKAIALQHGLLTERSRGIFSFSHLAFHEYFTARNIIMNSYLKSLEEALAELINHVVEPRWREIFLLTAVMLRKADLLVLLMKKKVNDLVMSDHHLQEFLIFSHQSSLKASSQSTDWNFTPSQQEILEKYYEINQLIRDCLNSNSEITNTVRKEIENELL
jgi:predicted NACHT family NTPase